MWRDIKKIIADVDKWELIYPRRCPICDEIIGKNKLICDICKDKLTVIKEPSCMKCGKPLHVDTEFCFDCSRRKHYYVRGCAMWLYDANMKASIRKFKFFGKKEYADYYAKGMMSLFKSMINDYQIEAVVPVPIHKKKYNIRGYNQASVLAKKLVDVSESSVLIIDDLLIRSINTLPQKELNDIERKKNLEKAFSIDKKSQDKYKNIKNVLLIDDIYTTGSTLDMCAKQLCEAGISKVYFLCISISYGN